MMNFAIIIPAGADITAADRRYSNGISSAASPIMTAPETEARFPTMTQNNCVLLIFLTWGFTTNGACVFHTNMLAAAAVDTEKETPIILAMNPPRKRTTYCMIPKWWKGLYFLQDLFHQSNECGACPAGNFNHLFMA